VKGLEFPGQSGAEGEVLGREKPEIKLKKKKKLQDHVCFSWGDTGFQGSQIPPPKGKIKHRKEGTKKEKGREARRF